MTPRCGVEQLPDDFSHTRSTVPLIFEARCWLQMQKITIKGQEAPECKKNKYNKTQVHDPIKAAFMSKQVNIQSFHTYYITLITISLSPTMTDCFDFCRRLLKCSRDHKRDIGNDYKHRELLLSPAYQWVKPVVVWLATSPPPHGSLKRNIQEAGTFDCTCKCGRNNVGAIRENCHPSTSHTHTHHLIRTLCQPYSLMVRLNFVLSFDWNFWTSVCSPC